MVHVKTKKSNTKDNNFDNVTGEKKKHNSNWPYINDHTYKILIIGGSGSRTAKALLNLISHQPDIDKIYLYAKKPYKAKYQMLIKKSESDCNDFRTFSEYSNDQDISILY